jgi:bifunctional NMN adenylyltransferase/nudix hydrolase
MVPTTTMDFITDFVKTPTIKNIRFEYDFIEKYKKGWANAPYAPTFVTADAVVVQSGHILVIERGQLPGKGLLALPGGFVKSHQTVKQASIDELTEETGILLADGPKSKDITKHLLERSIVDREIFDAPDRSLRGRTITTAFLYRLDDTKPLPKVKGQNVPLDESGGKRIVETRKAFWMPINDARAQTWRWFDDHHAIIDTMLGRMKD